MSKPKFSPSKCMKCQFHGEGIGFPIKGTKKRVYCNYASLVDSTCLHRNEKNEIIDIRGSEYRGCKLFIEGDRLEAEKPQIVVGVKRYDAEYY